MKLQEMSNTRRRVKLYVLNEERQWDDHGTGHVSSMYVDHEKMQGIVLLVRSEDDGKHELKARMFSMLRENRARQGTMNSSIIPVA